MVPKNSKKAEPKYVRTQKKKAEREIYNLDWMEIKLHHYGMVWDGSEEEMMKAYDKGRVVHRD